MDNNTLATYLGLGVQTVATVMQSYVTFKKSNVERYFELLLSTERDLSKIGQDEILKRLTLKIIDNVASEVNEEKIKNWKNLTVKLATEFTEFDFAENYCKILEDLTAFDLTVLFAIYSNEFKQRYFENELVQYFKNKNIEEDLIKHSLKRLARNFLISEEAEGTGFIVGGGSQIGRDFIYQKNSLGGKFLEIVSLIE